MSDPENITAPAHRVTRWVVPLVIITIGLLLLTLGFVYDVLFAGIPYQDPTPALSASYEFHSRVAGRIELLGVVVAGVGAVGAALMYGATWACQAGEER